MKLGMLTLLYGTVKLTSHVAPLQKSANILLARDFTAKIADVGECGSWALCKLPSELLTFSMPLRSCIGFC